MMYIITTMHMIVVVLIVMLIQIWDLKHPYHCGTQTHQAHGCNGNHQCLGKGPCGCGCSIICRLLLRYLCITMLIILILTIITRTVFATTIPSRECVH